MQTPPFSYVNCAGVIQLTLGAIFSLFAFFDLPAKNYTPYI